MKAYAPLNNPGVEVLEMCQEITDRVAAIYRAHHVHHYQMETHFETWRGTEHTVRVTFYARHTCTSDTCDLSPSLYARLKTLGRELEEEARKGWSLTPEGITPVKLRTTSKDAGPWSDVVVFDVKAHLRGERLLQEWKDLLK